MLKSLTAALKLSELREKLNDLNAIADPTDEQKTEERDLIASQKQAEREYRESLTEEANEHPRDVAIDTETRERLELRGRARVGDFIAAFVEGRSVDGASAEFRSAEGMTGYEIPLDLFEPIAGRVETRDVSGAPSDTPVDASPVQPYIYARGAAAFLGVDLVTVNGGMHMFPALTTPTTTAAKAKSGAADETVAVFTAAPLTPRRVTGSFRITLEDVAVFPQIEDALRRDLPASLAHRVNVEVCNGSGTAPALKSLRSQITAATDETTAETFASFLTKSAGFVDGRFASTLGEVRQIAGIDTYAKASGLFSARDLSAADALSQRSAGFRAVTTDFIPAKSGTLQTGIVRRGSQPMSAAAALWSGVRLIRDEVTSAAKGEIAITALQLISDVVLVQSDAWRAVSWKLS